MRKETGIAIGVVAVALVLILAGLFWPSAPDAPVVTESTPVEINEYEKDDDAVELPGRAVPDRYPDEENGSHDVTRIVVVDPDGEEITDLLSEKVIVDDKVVDQEGKAQ